MFFRAACLFFSFFLLSACSVGMALSGNDNPDLGALKVGATRGEVQLHLGPPATSQTLENGQRLDVYEYEIGNEPSAGRAAAHGVMDILTLGIWEVVGTPIEAIQGDKYKATIKYDKNDKVIDISSKKVAGGM